MTGTAAPPAAAVPPATGFAALWGGGGTAGQRLVAWAIVSSATFFILLHVYTGLYGAPLGKVFLPVHVCTALIVCFLIAPLGRRWHERLNPWSTLDLALIAGALWVVGYMLWNRGDWEMRHVVMSPLDTTTGLILVALVLEAVRRTVGVILSVVALVFVAHALFADHFPGIFYGPPVSLESLLVTLYVGQEGIFGIPVQVMANYVVLFILFGQLVTVAGAGPFFTRLAFALFGHRVGGPAKAAVVSSALMGSLSGSAIGNVLTTGAFTIPLMKRLGYRPAFAAGVEAAASTGGMVMPPVMGAIAFMMAEFTGRPYLEICVAAAVPALLYYFVIFVTVHLEARRHGLGRLNKTDLPDAWALVRRHGYLMLPLVLIVGTLVAGYSIVMVALVSIAGTFLLSFVRRATAMTPMRVAYAMEASGRATVGLSATAACAGIIIGAVFATGLTFQISQAAVAAAGSQLWLLLVITALMALVLGMGMTSSAVYITLVATVIPILKLAGVPDLAAHMFALYYGVLSNITPPVALAAFAAAPLAGANPLRAGFEASRIGLAAFVLPILFVYGPALLFIGTATEFLLVTASAAIGLSAVAVAFTGYLICPVNPLMRLALLAGAAMLVVPEMHSDLLGLAVIVVVVGIHGLAHRRAASPAPGSAGTGTSDDEGTAGGLIARMVGARIARERETEGEAGAAPRAGDMRDLLREEVAPGAVADHPAANLWLAWAVLGGVAAAVTICGETRLHATDPVVWLAVLLATSIAGAVGLVWSVRGAPVMSPKEV